MDCNDTVTSISVEVLINIYLATTAVNFVRFQASLEGGSPGLVYPQPPLRGFRFAISCKPMNLNFIEFVHRFSESGLPQFAVAIGVSFHPLGLNCIVNIGSC